MLRGGEKSQPDMRKIGRKTAIAAARNNFQDRPAAVLDSCCQGTLAATGDRGREGGKKWAVAIVISVTDFFSFSLLVFPIWWSGVRLQRCPFAAVSTYYLPVSLSPLTFFACANEIIRNIAMHLSFCSRPLCGLIHPLFCIFRSSFCSKLMVSFLSFFCGTPQKCLDNSDQWTIAFLM